MIETRTFTPNGYNPSTYDEIKMPARFLGRCGPYGTGEFYTGVKPGMVGTVKVTLLQGHPLEWAMISFSIGGAWLCVKADEIEILN